MLRPIVFGYMRAAQNVEGLDVRPVGVRKAIQAFADAEGYVVAQLFHEVVGTEVAMAAMIEEQDAAQRRLAEAGLPVVAVRHD